MKICVIHDLPDWQVTSHGNGVAYALVNKSAKMDVFFQGDDAQLFRETLEGLTEGKPALDYADALKMIWEDFAYCAVPMLDAIESASSHG